MVLLIWKDRTIVSFSSTQVLFEDNYLIFNSESVFNITRSEFMLYELCPDHKQILILTILYHGIYDGAKI